MVKIGGIIVKTGPTYWTYKKQNAKLAKEHTEKMAKEKPELIKKCIKNSVVYGGPDKKPVVKASNTEPSFIFDNTDSVSAAFKHKEGKTAILNFASYKNPGGKFIEGSSAQEEALCHASFLYNVLREFKGYYKYNNDHKNKALYTNRGIFSPDVSFEKDKEMFTACVITVPAPNKKAAQIYQNVSDEDNDAHLHARIEFIKRIAEEQNINTLILGAFGCGVFGQNPDTVAEAIKEIFKTSTVSKIILAVPGTDNNPETFKRVFT